MKSFRLVLLIGALIAGFALGISGIASAQDNGSDDSTTTAPEDEDSTTTEPPTTEAEDEAPAEADSEPPAPAPGTDGPPADRPEPDPEAIEAFRQCMADNGVDLPERVPGERPERPELSEEEREAFHAAKEACADLAPEGFGHGPGGCHRDGPRPEGAPEGPPQDGEQPEVEGSSLRPGRPPVAQAAA